MFSIRTYFAIQFYQELVQRSKLCTLDKCLLLSLTLDESVIRSGIYDRPVRVIAGNVSASERSVRRSIKRLSAEPDDDNPHGGWLVQVKRPLPFSKGSASSLLGIVIPEGNHAA